MVGEALEFKFEKFDNVEVGGGSNMFGFFLSLICLRCLKDLYRINLFIRAKRCYGFYS